MEKTKSSTSSRVTEFNDFVDTLQPELREKYRANYYALKDDDDKESSASGWWNGEYKRITPGDRVKTKKKLRTTDSQVLNGIPKKCEPNLLLPYTWYKNIRCLLLLSEHPFVQAGSIYGAHGVYHDRFLHIVTHPYTIHPYSDAYMMWNAFVCFFLLLSLFREPYNLTFQWNFFATNSNKSFGLGFSILMCIDVILTFFVGYVDSTTEAFILDPYMIRRNYLRGKFWYDIFTRLPWENILLSMVEDPTKKTAVTWIRLLAFTTKVMRFEKLRWFLYRLTLCFNLKSWTAQLFKHGVLVVFLTHWGACFHFLLPDVTNAHYFEEHKHYKKHSWVTRLELWDKPPEFQYINALLRSLAFILSLDGGLKIPRLFEEIITTGVLIFLSLSIVASLISTFATMVLEIQKGENQYQELTTCVQEYLRFRRIPKWLQQRVMAYFDGKFKGHFFSDSQFYTTITGCLKDEIVQFNCKGILERLACLNDISETTLNNFVQHLTFEVYIPGDVVLSPHRRTECMYFIEEGYFAVMNEFGATIEVLEDGFFGEVDLLCPAIPRKTSIVAISISYVYKLPKQECLECKKLFPEIHTKISNVANERIARDVQNLAEQMQRIDIARRWKQIVLEEKRSVEAYYADIDAGKIPAHHLPAESVQHMYYVNYQRSQKIKADKKKEKEDASKSKSPKV